MRITLAGIRPRRESVGPPGNHLRWAFPQHVGFPARGFSVYRRPSTGFKPDTCLDLSQATSFSPGSVLPGTGSVLPGTGSVLQNVRFVYPPSVQIQAILSGLSIQPPGEQLLELQFSQPVAYVRLDVRDPRASLSLSAYAGQHLVATSPTYPLPADTVSLEVAAPFITRVTIPLQFTTLLQVCYLGADTECRDPSWGRPIVHLPLPKTRDEALARLEKDLANRYAANRDAAVKRYGPDLDQLLKWLWLLQDPDSPAFEVNGAPPDELRLRPSEEDHPLQSIQPQSILLLAALDPNIARFLSLYWVDESVRRGQEATVAYDYKVEGHGFNQTLGCGLLLGLGPEASALPRARNPLAGQQLPGLRFLGREPLGRVGLHWPPPPGGQGAVHPVLFDLSRDSRNSTVLLTEETPVLVPAPAWQQDTAALFIEGDVPLGKHTYRLRPIDLFGQVGNEITSDPVAVEDLEAPPPPVRLRALLAQPGYPWLNTAQRQRSGEPAPLVLQFEYADAQHRQAPDAREFHLHWRETSLFESRTVTLEQVSATEPQGDTGARTYTVRVSDGTAIDLAPFDGGKLSRESGSGATLPAAERHHYQIADVPAPDQLRLAPSTHDFQEGTYRLISNPRLRSNWKAVDLSRPIRVDPPLVRPLQEVGPGFRARAVSIRTLVPEPDPLALLPAGHRPDTLADPTPFVEVELDRYLLEPDLFAGGLLLSGGQAHPILYSTAGGDNTPARIGLPAGTSLAPGTWLELRALAEVKGTVEHAERRSDNRVTLTLTPAPAHSGAGAERLTGGTATLDGQAYAVENAQPAQTSVALDLHASGKLAQDLSGWVGQEVEIKPLPTSTLTLAGSIPPGYRPIPGGEIAFDVPAQGNGAANPPVTYVGRVVSDLGTGDQRLDLLVRLSAAAQKALEAGGLTVRYYAPYQQELWVRLPLTTDTPDPKRTLVLSMAGNAGRENLFLALSTVDVRENEGALSSPAQVVAVKPPPTGAPDPPYPCGQAADAAAGYATPPDRRGLATLCLAWESGSLSTTDGMRYEVARALDSSVPATHTRTWLLGRAGVAAPVKAGPSLTGVLQAVSLDPTRGLHRAEFTADLGTTAAARFRGGRLSQAGAHFQVTVVALKSAGVLELMLRAVDQGTPVAGSAVLDGPPEYDELRHDPGALRQLAEAHPEAFGLVTGTPIKLQQFTDEIPGMGRNSFFYRVRAVDAAENRSEWSAVSVPFHQVDTTPPEAPRQLDVIPGRERAEVVWLPPDERDISGYSVYRTEGENPPELHPASSTPHATLSMSEVGPRLLRVIARQVTLPAPWAGPDLDVIRVLAVDAGSNAPNYFMSPPALTRLSNRRVEHLNPLIPDGTVAAVSIGDAAAPLELTHRPGSGEPLVIQGHAIDLTFGLDLTAIEALHLRGQIADDEDLEALLARPSVLQETNVTIDVVTRTITGLEDILPEGMAVEVVVRLTDGSLRLIRHTPGTLAPLRVADGQVALDLKIPENSLVGVYALAGAYASELPGLGRPDLRLTQPSSVRREGENGPIAAIANLNPLVPDGTAVSVTLQSTTGHEVRYDGDPSQYSWVDADLQADHVYQYSLAARKKVLFAPETLGGTPQERELASSIVGPVSTRTLRALASQEGDEL